MLDKRPEPDAGPGFIEVADYLEIRENRPSVLAECEGSRGTPDHLRTGGVGSESGVVSVICALSSDG
jgi:hypothetical protein